MTGMKCAPSIGTRHMLLYKVLHGKASDKKAVEMVVKSHENAYLSRERKIQQSNCFEEIAGFGWTVCN